MIGIVVLLCVFCVKKRIGKDSTFAQCYGYKYHTCIIILPACASRAHFPFLFFLFFFSFSFFFFFLSFFFNFAIHIYNTHLLPLFSFHTALLFYYYFDSIVLSTSSINSEQLPITIINSSHHLSLSNFTLFSSNLS